MSLSTARYRISKMICMEKRRSDGVVTQSLTDFVAEREWAQFHSEENLAKSIAIEAGELLECYQWDDGGTSDEIESELADVLTYGYLLAMKIGKSPAELILNKLEITRRKYPVEKARGTSNKYDQL